MGDVVTEITEAIVETAEGNASIDFEDFIDVLQQIGIDADDEDNEYNKSTLHSYFAHLLRILQCDSNDELNIDKFKQYIEKQCNSRTQLSALNYMEYLIDSFISSTKKSPKPQKDTQQEKKKRKKKKSQYNELHSAFINAIDEDNDNRINVSEFMTVICGVLDMDLTENECRQIYFQLELNRDYNVDVSYVLTQIHEEYLSLPDATARDLLCRYCSKILSEAAPFARLNAFVLDYILRDIDQVTSISCIGSTYTHPLLQRVSQQQRVQYTEKFRGFLQNVTPTIFGDVIRGIRVNSALSDDVIEKMHQEWMKCLCERHTIGYQHKDLSELTFLLFHLGLAPSDELLKRFRLKTYLETIYEEEVYSAIDYDASFVHMIEETGDFVDVLSGDAMDEYVGGYPPELSGEYVDDDCLYDDVFCGETGGYKFEDILEGVGNGVEGIQGGGDGEREYKV